MKKCGFLGESAFFSLFFYEFLAYSRNFLYLSKQDINRYFYWSVKIGITN